MCACVCLCAGNRPRDHRKKDPLTRNRKKKKKVCECVTVVVRPPVSGSSSSNILAASENRLPSGPPLLNTSVWLPLATGMTRLHGASLHLHDAGSLQRTVAEDEETR